MKWVEINKKVELSLKSSWMFDSWATNVAQQDLPIFMSRPDDGLFSYHTGAWIKESGIESPAYFCLLFSK